MKPKYMSVLAAILTATVGTNAARAIQKHDPIFQTHYVSSGVKDTDYVRLVRYQNGSPKAKADLYIAHSTNHVVDRDLVREIRAESGAPKWKSEQRLMPAPSK
jgi:hypothetical protein